MKKSAKLMIAMLLVVLLVSTLVACGETGGTGGTGTTDTKHTITFDCDGGSEVLPITQDHNTLVVKPTDPQKAGHIFEGWYKDRNFATIFDFATELLTKDITIYAKWSNLLSFEETTDGGVALTKYSGSEESVVVPSTYNGKAVTSIKQGAFEGCNNLTSITLPFVGGTLDGANSTVFGYIFGASSYSDNKTAVPASLKTVVITGGTSIKDNAFRFCGSLTGVTIPDSATSIGKWAFSNCASLASVTIGSGVKNIGYNAFQYCKGLTSIVIPDSVESIEKEAFRKCSGLTSI
ncbi:MAG: leucine-rich repeat protein, partial [Clostridia bacterium]